MTKVDSQRSWVLPDEPVPVRLMSTIWADTDGMHDDFANPKDVDDWLDAIGVDRAGCTTTADEWMSARALRDAVRRLAAHVTGDDRPTATSAMTDVDQAVLTVNQAALHMPVANLKIPKGGGLTVTLDCSASRITASLAQVAVESRNLLGVQGGQLRACHAPGCVLYFTKTHPRREWCSVTCGNRIRAARHYETVKAKRGG